MTSVTHAKMYLRLSDFRADSIDSFDARADNLRALGKRLGWTLVEPPIIENDMSGKRKSASAFKRKTITLPDGTTALRTIRPGFRGIIADLMSGAIDGVLCEDLDRLLRDARDGEDLLDAVQITKANVRSLSGSLALTDGGTNSERTMARVMTAFAAASSADTSRRLQDERVRRAADGRWAGGRRPYGFAVDGSTPIAEEVAVLLDCSRRVVQGATISGLAAELREKGVPATDGGEWTSQQLRKILKRPRNAGILVHLKKEAGPAPWPAVVPVEVFRAVVTILNDPSRKTTPGPAPKHLGTGIYLCGHEDCSAPMVTSGRNGRSTAYRCSASAHLVRVKDAVDDYVLRSVAARLDLPNAASIFVAAPVDIDAVALRAEAAAIQENLKGLAADRALGYIDRDSMIKATQVGRDQIRAIHDKLNSAVVDSPIGALMTAEDKLKALIEMPLQERRTVVSTVVQVTILPLTHSKKAFDPEAVDIEFDKTKWRLTT